MASSAITCHWSVSLVCVAPVSLLSSTPLRNLLNTPNEQLITNTRAVHPLFVPWMILGNSGGIAATLQLSDDRKLDSAIHTRPMTRQSVQPKTSIPHSSPTQTTPLLQPETTTHSIPSHDRRELSTQATRTCKERPVSDPEHTPQLESTTPQH